MAILPPPSIPVSWSFPLENPKRRKSSLFSNVGFKTLVVWTHLTSAMNLLVVHETLKPQGLISAGVCSYLFLYTLIFFFFFFSLDKTAFAGRIKPACRTYSELQSPGDQKWIVASSIQELQIKHKGMGRGPLNCTSQEMGLITWHIYPALIPVGLWPLQYPRSPAGRLTLPLPLVQENWKGVWERREEEEEGISCRQ